MKYEELVSKIKEEFMKADVSKVKGHIAYQFNIEGEAEGAFYAEITDGTLSIEPYEYYDRDVLFTTTAETLLAIMEGKLDAVKAFTLGKLKVEGDFDKALKLQSFTKKEAKKSNTEKSGAENTDDISAGRTAEKKEPLKKTMAAKAAAAKKAGKEIVEKKKTTKTSK